MIVSFNHVSIKAIKNKRTILKVFGNTHKRGDFFYSTENKKLIKNLFKFLNKGFITLTASGHDAILIALKSLNLANNDEVIFPVNAYPTAFPIAQAGVKLVPTEVDSNGLIDISQLSKKLSKKTRAIVIVHLYGLVVDVDKIKQVIKGKRIAIVEDCAQAFGSRYKNKLVGTLGNVSCFSFYPTKNLGTLGDGGAIWTKHKKLQRFFEKAISYGEIKRYQSEFISGHSRLPEIQAGILNVYLKNFKKETQLKSKVIKNYIKTINKHKLNKYIRVLFDNKNTRPVLHMFVVEVNNRNKLRNYLQKKGIPTLIHYPVPIHLQKAFKYLRFKRGDFPMAERLSKNILSLPFHSYLKSKEIKYIVKSIKDFYE